MVQPGLKAIEISRARRSRLYVWLAITAFVSGLMVAAFVIHFERPPPVAPQVELPASASVSMDPPVVKIRNGAILLGDREVARTDDVSKNNRIQRIDGLYDALKEIRITRGASASSHQSVILDLAPDTPALVVKSVFQTSGLAGFDDVEFATIDGGVIRP